jgi:hypothetical protein
MKTPIFGHAEINISHAALSRAVNALLSFPAISRRSLAKNAGINENYAGRILCAMEKCNLLTTPSYTSPRGYELNKNIASAVLDLSAARFSLSVIRSDGQCIFHYVADDYSFSFSDSIYPFLSRCAEKMNEDSVSASLMCVLHGGNINNKKQIIDGICADVFCMVPQLYINSSDAASAIFDFRLLPYPENKGAAYIRLSEDITALYRDLNGRILNCDASRLIFDKGISLSAAYAAAHSCEELGEITARIMTAMDFSGELGVCIIESDRFGIHPKFTEILRREYFTVSRPIPEIYSSSMTPGYLISAAAKLSLADLLLSLIKTP